MKKVIHQNDTMKKDLSNSHFEERHSARLQNKERRYEESY